MFDVRACRADCPAHGARSSRRGRTPAMQATLKRHAQTASSGRGLPPQLLQKRDKPFLDRLFEVGVLGLKSLPDCEQPRPSAQDGATFLLRGYASVVTGLRSSRCALTFPCTTLPLFLRSFAKLQRINRHVGLDFLGFSSSEDALSAR